MVVVRGVYGLRCRQLEGEKDIDTLHRFLPEFEKLHHGLVVVRGDDRVVQLDSHGGGLIWALSRFDLEHAELDQHAAEVIDPPFGNNLSGLHCLEVDDWKLHFLACPYQAQKSASMRCRHPAEDRGAVVLDKQRLQGQPKVRERSKPRPVDRFNGCAAPVCPSPRAFDHAVPGVIGGERRRIALTKLLDVLQKKRASRRASLQLP